MSQPEYIDVTRDKTEPHATLPQYRVEHNTDPAMSMSNEHYHAHLHHNVTATAGRDEVEYSKGTTFEPSIIPHQDPQDHALHRRHHHEEDGEVKNGAVDITDAEKGTISPIQVEEEDPQTHTLARFYGRYKIGFHIFVWLLFTGYVSISLTPITGLYSSLERLSMIV